MALSVREQVRLLIGDDDASERLLSDDEIDHFADQHSILVEGGGTVTNVVAAAADGAAAVAAKFGPDFRFSEDGQVFDRQQAHEHYMALEDRLRRRAGGTSALLTLAGTASVTA